MVGEVTINQALGQQQNTTNATAQLADDFAQFLTLLTVQLQNQDPLSPMDSTEFTNQLVAFSGVEQQINANQKLDDLVALQIGTAFSSSQSYVDQDVSYISSEFDFTGAPSQIRYSLGSTAAFSKINISDEQGTVIYSENANTGTGAHDFVWDGRMNGGGRAPPGTYQVNVDALDANDVPIEVTTVVNGRVRGTESQNGQIFLLVGERAVALSSILNTSSPSTLVGNNETLTMALDYIGLDISYINDEILYDGSTQVDIDYSLTAPAAQAKIIIRNDVGQVIFTDDAPTGEGENSYVWNGLLEDGTPAPPGIYEFTIDALDISDDPIAYTSVASGTVTGVETIGGQIFLNIGTTSIDISDVLSANLPVGA